MPKFERFLIRYKQDERFFCEGPRLMDHPLFDHVNVVLADSYVIIQRE
jgi:hypothetical protein